MQLATKMLLRVLQSYKPSYYDMMGKVGYECNFCGAMVKDRRNFDKPEEHRDGCVYIEANKYAEERAERDERRYGV